MSVKNIINIGILTENCLVTSLPFLSLILEHFPFMKVLLINSLSITIIL